jgi:hypothetical protein
VRSSPWSDLEQSTASTTTPATPDPDDNVGEKCGTKKNPTQSQRLVELAIEFASFWHSPDNEPFATIEMNGHHEHWPVRSHVFKLALRQRFFDRYGKAPASQPIADALGVLEGQALFRGDSCPVAVRIAEDNGSIYLDLGGPDWQAVEITSTGWRVVVDPPVRFRRARGMAALPVPVAGGTLNLLRPFVPGGDNNLVLIAGWLVQALRPAGPYIVLILLGEQGSGKSLLARILRSLLDPNTVPLRSLPREDRDLAITANNGFVIALDNISGLSGWVSDAVCRLATGGGFATRELYTDSDETLFTASRPVVMNGIGDVASRPDLIDRAMFVSLPTIDDAGRRDERDLMTAFEAVAPQVLGALLDAIVMALRNRGTVKVDRLPRMADATLWVVGAEPALPWAPGSFLAAYQGNRRDAVEVAVDADVVAVMVMSFMRSLTTWQGTATDLLGELEKTFGDVRRPRDWPRSAGALSGRLMRLAPALRAVGIEVSRKRREAHTGRRFLLIEKREELPPSPSSPDRGNRLDSEGLGSVMKGDGRGGAQDTVTSTVTRNRNSDGDGDEGDGPIPISPHRRLEI